MKYVMLFATIAITIVGISAVYCWRKKYYISKLYTPKNVAMLILEIDTIIAAGWVVVIFIMNPTWDECLAMLLMHIILVLVFMYESTICIYALDFFLYKKCIFYTKRIKITENTVVLEKSDRRIVVSGKQKVSIDHRHLDGDVLGLLREINVLISIAPKKQATKKDEGEKPL